MELSQEQYARIKDCLPRQRGNVRVDNFTLLNALLYVLEHGGKWRGLPARFGRWHTIYMRLLLVLAGGADREHPPGSAEPR